MSYERDLATHYNDVHQRLLGSPPIDPIPSCFPRQPLPTRKELESLLLRMRAIEERLEMGEKTLVSLDKIVIVYPHNPQGIERILKKIFKIVHRYEQQLNPRLHITVEELLGSKRIPELVDVRHLMFYLMATLTNKTTTEIGNFFKKDHSTIIHGRDRIINERLKNPILDMKLRWYEAEIARQIAVDNPVESRDKETTILTEVSESI